MVNKSNLETKLLFAVTLNGELELRGTKDGFTPLNNSPNCDFFTSFWQLYE